MKDVLLAQLGRAILWFGRVFAGYNRLEKLDMVKLRAPIQEAVELYGPALESKMFDEFSEATEHVFDAGPYHEAVIYEWNGLIHSITYWSTHADPNRDLCCMFERFGEGHKWRPLSEGYLYVRDDSQVRLWCSAAPGIGVATVEYLDAKSDFKGREKSTLPE